MSRPRPASPGRRRAGELVDVVVLGAAPAAVLVVAHVVTPLLALPLGWAAAVVGRALLVPAGASPGCLLLRLRVVAAGGAPPTRRAVAAAGASDLAVVVLSLGLAAPRLLLDAEQDPWRRTPLDRLVGLVVLDGRRRSRSRPETPRPEPLRDVTAEVGARLRARRVPWLLEADGRSTPVGDGLALAGLRWQVRGDVLVARPEVDGVTLRRGAAERSAPRGRAVTVLSGDALRGPDGVVRVRRDENVF